MQQPLNHEPNGFANRKPDYISEKLEQLCIKPLTEIEKLELKQWAKLIEKKKENYQIKGSMEFSQPNLNQISGIF